MIPRRDNGNGKVKRRQVSAEMIDRKADDIAYELFDMKPDRIPTPKWHWMIRFAEEYMKDFDAELAYIRADGQSKNAKQAGNNILNNPVVQELIAKRQVERRKRVDISLDRVLEEIASLAFFNPKDLYDAEGNIIPIHQLPREVAAAISSVKAIVRKSDDGDISTKTLEFRQWNKNQALELFMRHYGALNDKMTMNVNENRTVTVRLQIDQVRENLTPDEIKQLLRLHSRLPQIAASGDAATDGHPRQVRPGNGSGGNCAQGVH